MGCHPGGLEHRVHRVDQRVIAELHHRHVDGDIQLRQAGDGVARLAQHPLADGNDKAALFREGNERIGGEQPQLGVVPADERLDPEQLQGPRVAARLEQQDELVGNDSSPQVALQRPPTAHLVVHVVGEIGTDPRACSLGLDQRQLGTTHEALGVLRIERSEGNAHVGLRIGRRTGGQAHGGVQRQQQPPGQAVHRLRVADAGGDDDEPLRIHPRHQVAVAHATADASRRLGEDEIARRRAEQRVEMREIVQVEAKNGKHPPGFLR